ncbi:MAG: hypothetical protein Q8S54_08670 [Bacteroidota bacterium]|nr:hypothetical protein [Bacteroidota bacterium]
MKITLKNTLVFLSALLVSCTTDQQQFVRESKKDFDKRLIYLIDGKQASKAEAIRQNDAGIVNLIEAAPDSRSALLQYGEKYRYGILILVTNDKEKK